MVSEVLQHGVLGPFMTEYFQLKVLQNRRHMGRQIIDVYHEPGMKVI
jgi:hypothetical protein